MIQNLSQLKRAINEKKRFEIVRHFKHPAFAGQIRKPNKLQTNAFYSVVDGQPEHEVSKANGGIGYRMLEIRERSLRMQRDNDYTIHRLIRSRNGAFGLCFSLYSPRAVFLCLKEGEKNTKAEKIHSYQVQGKELCLR